MLIRMRIMTVMTMMIKIRMPTRTNTITWDNTITEMVRMRKKRNDENEKKSDDKNDLRKIFAATSPLSPPARSLTSGAHQ